MSFAFLDSTARSAWQSATSQQAQLEGLDALFPSGPTLRYYSAAGVHIDTVTHDNGVITVNGADREWSPGAIVARTPVTPGTATYVIAATAPSGGTDILRADIAPMTIVTGSRPNLQPQTGGAGLVVQASAGLPVVDNARITIWGQSNAVGRANRTEISSSPLSADSGLATYDAGTFDRVWIWSGSAYIKLQPSVFNGPTVNAGQFGPEFGLAVRWMRETSAGDLYLEKPCEGGISITAYEPPSATWYAIAAAERVQADAWLTSNASLPQVEAMLWVQGEQDAAQTQSWYQTRLSEMIDAARADGILGASSLVVLSRMHPSSSTYGAGVDDAKVAYAAANHSNSVTVQMPNYLSDTIHLNGRGQVQHGYDAYKAIFGGAQIDV